MGSRIIFSTHRTFLNKSNIWKIWYIIETFYLFHHLFLMNFIFYYFFNQYNCNLIGGFANATAGGIFYMNAFVSSCIFRKIASNWPKTMIEWEKHEKDAKPNLKLRNRLRIIAYIILVCALGKTNCALEQKNISILTKLMHSQWNIC